MSACWRGSSRSSSSPSSSPLCGSCTARTGERRSEEPQHRVRVPRPAGGFPIPDSSFRPHPTCEGCNPRGAHEHAAAGRHRDHPVDRPRHVDRHRSAVAELHPPQRGADLRRDHPQRAAAGHRRAGLRGDRPQRLPAAERVVDARSARRARRPGGQRVLVRG